jgi:hypothetical protein
LTETPEREDLGVWRRVDARVTQLARARLVRSRPLWFSLVQGFLIVGVVSYGVTVREWIQGDRFTGVVVEVEHAEADACEDPKVTGLTLRDPRTERELRVPKGSWVLNSDSRVGDSAVAIIKRGQPTQIASPGQVDAAVAWWIVLLVATLFWPVTWAKFRRSADPRHGLPPVRGAHSRAPVIALNVAGGSFDPSPGVRVGAWWLHRAGIILLVTSGTTWIWATVFDHHATSVVATGVWYVGVVAVSVGWWAGRLPTEPGDRHEWRLAFWSMELALLTAFITLDCPLEWWRHGERFTGVVVDVELNPNECPPDVLAWTVRDPETEREVRVVDVLNLADSSLSVGDSATAVIAPGDSTDTASPEQLNQYLTFWKAAAVMAVIWPIAFWSLYTHDTRQNHPVPAATARGS